MQLARCVAEHVARCNSQVAEHASKASKQASKQKQAKILVVGSRIDGGSAADTPLIITGYEQYAFHKLTSLLLNL
jgi:hypothetical protein